MTLAMNTKQRGAIAVLAVAKKLAAKGIMVAFPMGDYSRYDLLLELHGRFARVQIKISRNYNGMLEIHFYSTSTQGGKFIHKRYTPVEIEAIIGYNPSTDSMYILPPKLLKQGTFWLRLEPTTNSQKKGINWAKDYENALRNIKWKS